MTCLSWRFNIIALVICALLHAVIASFTYSSWVIPDITFACFCLLVIHSPKQWLLLVCAAAMLMMGWSIRFSGVIFFNTLIAGWIIYVLSKRLDLSDIRGQCMLVICLMLGTSALMLWVEQKVSGVLFGFAILRAMSTGLSLLILRFVLRGGIRRMDGFSARIIKRLRW